jgi:hypothetical protein
MPISLTKSRDTCKMQEVDTYPESTRDADALIRTLEQKTRVYLDYQFVSRKIVGSELMAVDMRIWGVARMG